MEYEHNWYYTHKETDEEKGPILRTELRELFRSGELAKVWSYLYIHILYIYNTVTAVYPYITTNTLLLRNETE